ncbi:hypothetical protein [Reyranella sp.]
MKRRLHATSIARATERRPAWATAWIVAPAILGLAAIVLSL